VVAEQVDITLTAEPLQLRLVVVMAVPVVVASRVKTLPV
jgi:hypothetical protein